MMDPWHIQSNVMVNRKLASKVDNEALHSDQYMLRTTVNAPPRRPKKKKRISHLEHVAGRGCDQILSCQTDTVPFVTRFQMVCNWCESFLLAPYEALQAMTDPLSDPKCGAVAIIRNCTIFERLFRLQIAVFVDLMLFLRTSSRVQYARRQRQLRIDPRIASR